MPRIRAIHFTEEELKFIAFLVYKIGGSMESYRKHASTLTRKFESKFSGGRDYLSEPWYQDMKDKVDENAKCIYFRS